MRLIYAVERPHYPCVVGGDGTIAHTLMKQLHQRDVAGVFVGMFDESVESRILQNPDISIEKDQSGVLGYRLPYKVVLAPENHFLSVLEQQMIEYRPHFVITQLNRASEILGLAKKHRIANAVYILDVTYPENVETLQLDPDYIFAVSGFVQKHILNTTGRQSVALPPAIDPEEYRTSNCGDKVTFINPVYEKGVELAIDIARQNRDVEFLFVEGWRVESQYRAQIEALKNITWMDKQRDMRRVYRQTRLLLVPSVWEEAFGRVVLEAQCSGIPVVASNVGGLAEAVGNGGLIIGNRADTRTWSRAIRRLLDNENLYARLSQAAIDNVDKYSLADVMGSLMCCLEGDIPGKSY